MVLKEYGNNSLDIALTQCTSNKYSGDIHIPSQFTDWYWVDNGEGILVSVGREVNIKYISDNAFRNCTGLTSVTIDDNIPEIGNYAFAGCTSLKSVTLPKRLKTIAPNLFNGDSSLTSVTIKDSVTAIGSYAFRDCSSLTTLALPETINEIGECAFYGCSSLTSINIPNSVETLSSNIFGGCSSLASIEIPQGVRDIKSYAFSGCSGLTTIKIPYSVTSIGYEAFSGCIGLTTIKIPNSVTTISSCAFKDCDGLTSIIIPESVRNTYWGEPEWGLFDGCDNLETIILLCDNISFYSILSSDVPPANATVYAYPSEIDRVREFWNGDIQEIPIGIDQEASISEVSFRIGNVNSIAGLPFAVTRVIVNETAITPDASGRYHVKTNGPGTSVSIGVDFTLDGEEHQHKFRMTSAGTLPALSTYSRTQTTATFTVSAPYDDTAQPSEIGVYVNGQNYPAASGDIEDADSVKRGRVKVTGLRPGRTYNFEAYAKYNGETTYGKVVSEETKDIYAYFSYENVTPTTMTLKGRSEPGDAIIEESWFTINGVRYDSINGVRYNRGNATFTGLQPSRGYDVTFNYTTEDGSTASSSISKIITKELELTMLNPQPVSSTCAIVAAETNISDAETNVGFQWRKYEAPETLPSSEGYAAIYDGRIEGYIKRLQSASFYNARAFYKSNSGTYYYSDWVTFDPSDFSYFEPTVHTYAVETVTESTASVRGYVLAGTDEITQQGFEYWPEGGTESAAKQMAVAIADNAAGDGVSVVLSTGQVMTATLDGLSPATTYRIRAFVTTAQGTTYGEEQTFTTAKPTGIAAAEEQAEAPAIVGYYDLSGRPLESPQKGITIVRYSDGTCKKIFKR